MEADEDSEVEADEDSEVEADEDSDIAGSASFTTGAATTGAGATGATSAFASSSGIGLAASIAFVRSIGNPSVKNLYTLPRDTAFPFQNTTYI